MVSLQLLIIALAASVVARPPNEFNNGRKPSSTLPSSTTAVSSTRSAASTTAAPTNPAQPSGPFFPFWPFRGFNGKGNNKCFSDYKDCRKGAGSDPGACVSTYAACIGSTRANSRMPATSVTSAPGSMPTSQRSWSILPPLSHIGKHHGRVRKCNEAYWTCRKTQSASQSCYTDLSTCLANIGATSTGLPSSTAAASTTASTTATSVVATGDGSQDDDDDDDGDDDTTVDAN